MELWDAYDKDFHLIPDLVLVRGEPIPEGICHLVCEILVRHTDGSYLIMQRDPRKPFGGMWEATAGGSALRGETPAVCARRELREETGIDSDALIELGSVPRPETYYMEYLCVTDCEKDSVTLQEGETVAYRWVSREELIALPGDVLLTRRVQQHFLPELRSENGQNA